MQYGSSKEHVNREVSSRHYGHGKVIDSRRSGNELQVRFGNFVLWLPLSELSFLDEPEPATPAPQTAQQSTAPPTSPALEELRKLFALSQLKKEPPATPATSDTTPQKTAIKTVSTARNSTALVPAKQVSRLQNRRMIEALRLGLVVPEDIELFTFHRAAEQNSIENGFKETQDHGGAVRIIEGEYGSGKSHFLEYIKTMALKNGYVVLRTELDAFEIQPNRPKRIYNSLMHSITTPDKGVISLREIISLTCQEDKIYHTFTRHPTYHHYLGPAMKLARHKSLGVDGITWGDWIEGEAIVMDAIYQKISYLPSLFDYYKAGNIYCNILSGIAYLVKLMGYKGTVLLIDEAESLCNLAGYRKFTADAFFKGLMLITLGNKRSPFSENDLISTKRRRIGYTYQETANLFFIMAFTPRDLTPDVIRELPESWIISLSVFDYLSLKQLIFQLWDIYQHAHEMPLGARGEFVDRLPVNLYKVLQREYISLRQAIKMSVETFDLIRHFPQISASAILDELLRNLPA